MSESHPPLTRARIDGALKRAGHAPARWHKRRIGGDYTLGYRIEFWQHEGRATIHDEPGYISVAGHREGQQPEAVAARVASYAKALTDYGYVVEPDASHRRLVVREVPRA